VWLAYHVGIGHEHKADLASAHHHQARTYGIEVVDEMEARLFIVTHTLQRLIRTWKGCGHTPVAP